MRWGSTCTKARRHHDLGILKITAPHGDGISISYECTSHSRWWYRKEYGYYCSIDACYPTNELGNYVLVESLEGSCPDSPYFSISEEGYIKWQTRDTPSERF
jgi:hypothetical protein